MKPPAHIDYPAPFYGHADEIVDGIWIGSRPPPGTYLADLGFTNLLGCEVDWPLAGWLYPSLRLGYFPFQDDARPENHAAAQSAAEAIHTSTGPILVHCFGGINRSGYAVALALVKRGLSPREIVREMRGRRREFFAGQPALHNLAFLTALGVPDLAVPGIGGAPAALMPTPVTPGGASPFDDVPKGVTFVVQGFTGLDVLWELLLSEKRHARSIARRWGRGQFIQGHFVQMPSGKVYEIVDDKGNVIELVAHHPV